VVEISLLGSEGARVGNCPGYLTSRGINGGYAALVFRRAAQQNDETLERAEGASVCQPLDGSRGPASWWKA